MPSRSSSAMRFSALSMVDMSSRLTQSLYFSVLEAGGQSCGSRFLPCSCSGAQDIDACREIAQLRPLKQVLQRQVDAEAVTDSPHKLHCEQRMYAGLEKIGLGHVSDDPKY